MSRTITLRLTDEVYEELREAAQSENRPLSNLIETAALSKIREHPHVGPHIRRLRGFEPPTWRFRIGSWRFFYEIDEKEKIVLLLAASHRSSAYD
jgi:mRNA interferase RelE/StbE